MKVLFICLANILASCTNCYHQVYVIVYTTSIVSGESGSPDNRTVPTPPSFVHAPNPDLAYFVLEPVSHNNVYAHLHERKFSCIAIGYPDVTYRWTKNGSPLDLLNSMLSNRVTLFPGEGSFKLNKLKSSDEGVYQCIAENKYGTAIDQEINFRNGVLNFFSNSRQETVEVNYGDPFSKECIAPHSVPPARSYWMLKSNYGSGPLRFVSINSSNVVVNDKYVSENENKTDDLYFTCAAENKALNDYKFGYSFKFFVRPSARNTSTLIPPTEQYVSPSQVTVLKGESLELYCVFSGTPDLIPTWYKDGAILPDSVFTDNRSFRKSVKIESVNESDQGKYACKFDRTSQINKEFTVTVEAAPYWGDHRQSNVNSSRGSDAQFHCDARGKPSPKITFFKNGLPVESSERVVVRNDKLIISNVQFGENGTGDNGVYQCKAQNAHGSLWTNLYLNLL